MGMYTELILGCSLSKDTPKVCIDTLDFLINETSAKASESVKAFIKEYELDYLLYGSSYYFGMSRSSRAFWYDKIANDYRISVRSSIKNYQNQIEKFLSYIKLYVTCGSGEEGIYAYVLYEEDSFPTAYSMHGIYELTKLQ